MQRCLPDFVLYAAAGLVTWLPGLVQELADLVSVDPAAVPVVVPVAAPAAVPVVPAAELVVVFAAVPVAVLEHAVAVESD